MKRKLVDSLDRRKESMINSLWSNSNYDDDKGTRKGAVADIESSYDEAIAKILGTAEVVEEHEDQFGFIAAGERGLEKIAPAQQFLDTSSVAEVVEGLDQR